MNTLSIEKREQHVESYAAFLFWVDKQRMEEGLIFTEGNEGKKGFFKEFFTEGNEGKKGCC